MKKVYALKQSFVLTAALLFFVHYIQAQNIFPATGSAGIGTTTPNASSILEMISTTKGILIPRMTIAQRNAVVSPAIGLMIYQTNNTTGFYYYNGNGWKAITPKAGWLLTGNAGIDPAASFIGTTDAQPLVFKVNNQKAGYLGASATANTAFGYQTLDSNTSGVYNTAIGYDALLSNVSGNYNTANGFRALTSNTYGYYNIADGANALYNNTTGFSNVAVGSNALFHNTGSYNLVAVGDSALYNQNGGVGLNTAVGSKALFSNTTGNENTATGYQALSSNTTGFTNTATGNQALYSNTMGFQNTATGYQTLYSNTNGSNNTANGIFALSHNTTGSINSAFGISALLSNLDGSGNTAIGYSALTSNSSGNNNTAIGFSADVNSGGYSGSSAFGYNAAITASNQVRIGDPSILSIGGYQSWTTLPSDKRVKKNIKENVPGLAFINKLKPVTYNLDLNAIDKIVQRPEIKDKDGKTIQPSQQESDSRKAKEQIVFTGFVAQDVEAAASSIHYDFSGVDKPKNDKDIYGLRYSDFVVPLVKAVQELSKQNDELKKDYAAKIDELQKQIDDLKAMVISGNQKAIISSPSGVGVSSLDQNVPNPFSKATTINYSLPQKYSSAKIIVIDELGNTIKIFNLSGTGKGTLNFSSPFRVGASYQYSLFVDGKLIDTKQMVLAK